MTRSQAPAISVRGLRKAYGRHVVLDGIDLEVGEGTVFALLGPNGAGKTTTIQVLSTLLAPDAGEVTIGGYRLPNEAQQVRRLIALTGQVSAVDAQFSGEENLRLMAELHHLGRAEGRRRVDELLDRFELRAVAGRPTSTYSGGERRRLDLAMTLVGSPRIIFLDEPTTGLDPRSRRMLWGTIRELVAGGITIFLTTQYLEEADRLASRIALLDGGRVVAQGTPAELKRLVPGGSVRLDFAEPADLERASRAIADGTPDETTLSLQVPSDGGVHSVRALLDRLDAASIEVEGLAVRSADLDDVFLALTGRRHDEETPA